jgi:hypothetical protein
MSGLLLGENKANIYKNRKHEGQDKPRLVQDLL